MAASTSSNVWAELDCSGTNRCSILSSSSSSYSSSSVTANLDDLPSEILEKITWHSNEPGLLLVNRKIYSKLPAPRKFMHSLLTLAICGDKVVMNEVLGTNLGVDSAPTSITNNEQKRLQQVVFSQSWCTAQRFNRVAFCIARAWLKRWIPESQVARNDRWAWWDAQNCSNILCTKPDCGEPHGYSLVKLFSQELRWKPELHQGNTHAGHTGINFWELSLEMPSAFRILCFPRRVIQSRKNTSARDPLRYLSYLIDELERTSVVSVNYAAFSLSAIQRRIKAAARDSDCEAVWALSRVERSFPSHHYNTDVDHSCRISNIFPATLRFQVSEFRSPAEFNRVFQRIRVMKAHQPFPSFPMVIETLFRNKDWISIARMLYTYCKWDLSFWSPEEPFLGVYSAMDTKTFLLRCEEPEFVISSGQQITLVIHELPTKAERVQALFQCLEMYDDPNINENTMEIFLTSTILRQYWRFRPGPELVSRCLNEELPGNISRHPMGLCRKKRQEAELEDSEDEDDGDEDEDYDANTESDSDSNTSSDLDDPNSLMMRPYRPRNCPRPFESRLTALEWSDLKRRHSI